MSGHPGHHHHHNDHFDDVAGEYDESIAAHVMAHLTARRTALVDRLVGSGRVLDVGCGTGSLLEEVDARYERFGVDFSLGMLRVARARELRVAQASGGALPFATGEFDGAMTFAVLHHLIDPDLVEATIREMCRVVKRRAPVIIWDHNPLNPYWPILMKRLPQDHGDERLVALDAITSVLEAQGMLDIRVQRLTFLPDFTPKSLLRAATAVERVLEATPGVRRFAAHNVVTARRP